MARYSLRRPTYEDIPRLQYFEQVEGKGTEIGLVLKSEDEWKHVIDTYEYFKVCVDNERDDYVWGYILAAQVENNLWIREIFFCKEYRDDPEKRKYIKLEGFGGIDKLPLYGAVKYARERGGMVIAPIASDNKRAVSAMLGAYGFRLDRIIERWYDPKDLAIYIEDTGTTPYQNV
jgi:hypothetical protein